MKIIINIVPWRRLKGRANLLDVFLMRDGIDVEGFEHLRVRYKRLKAIFESLNGMVKSRLAYGRFTWQGLRNALHSHVPAPSNFHAFLYVKA